MLSAQTAKEAIQLGQALPVCPDASETLLHPGSELFIGLLVQTVLCEGIVQVGDEVKQFVTLNGGIDTLICRTTRALSPSQLGEGEKRAQQSHDQGDHGFHLLQSLAPRRPCEHR